uniref:Uncharacterized protein n=1 Tax=uncultured Armatimonadetes bacterium TaxID=157466 RepID=A0A6J4IWD7_9BACT|nr:hypothetical protein AVDCRST_MAG63-3218 [uncultured Armatimonadetes bacterium]
MGLSYSYLVFMERAKFLDALQTVAAFAEDTGPDARTAVALCGRAITLPFAYSGSAALPDLDPVSYEAPIALDTPRHTHGFRTSLFFEEADEAVASYVEGWTRGVRSEWKRDPTNAAFQDWLPPRDDRGRAAIGYIYLTVWTDLSYDEDLEARDDYGPDLVLLQFTAATSDMSRLFEESAAVRRAFVSHAAGCGAVCGLLDRRNSDPGDAVVFWLDGREHQGTVVSRAWLPLDEIRRQVAAAAPDV